MDHLRIEPVTDGEGKLTALSVRVACDCGKTHFLTSTDGGHPSFCGTCEQAFFLKSHDHHFHIQHQDMSRSEMLQQSYGRVLAMAKA